MSSETLACRIGCGACCIAPSISSAIPGMPHGKPAGVRCVQLSADNRCLIFGRPERPKVCSRLSPEFAMCGESSQQAMRNIAVMESLTLPTAG
ncbi:YkgJ family cysteine cluster protein [Pseudolysobacter antarcticus]|uniref:YkgJ family cysteine cluster protein n=1 Tax=Pseudolysobacter antarcticus TaxID=2511995 RepID=A0A411HPG0_9GAMM|nr:YkgJ family cysteine cluster protein [Pseudolysobacter antarcticus]QBB72352.1 YkgJ family cysteine cluster protein [Pseudolysobacter antarcticus]